MENAFPNLDLAECGELAELPRNTATPQAKGPGTSYSQFTIHYLLLQLIGSDRSAFAASRHKVAGQSKTKESCQCSIHGEGLLEHPIKNLKP
jgi:hypothetical protein